MILTIIFVFRYVQRTRSWQQKHCFVYNGRMGGKDIVFLDFVQLEVFYKGYYLLYNTYYFKHRLLYFEYM